MRVKSVVLVVGFLAVLMLLGGIRVASAEVEIGELGKVFDKFLIGGEVNAFYRYDNAPYFGAHVVKPDDKGTHFGEVYAVLSFTALKDVGWANLQGTFSINEESTIDHDFYGIYSNKSEVDLNQAYLKFGSIFKSPFDVTVGRQNINIEKSMVIGQGYFQKAAAWLLFNWAFPMGVRVDGNFGAFSTTAFWAQAENYWQDYYFDPNNDTIGRDDVSVAGINLHYNFTDKAYAYAGFYRKIDNSDLFLDTFEVRMDTNNYDFGLDLTSNRIAGGIINLEGEFNYQNGDAGKLDGTQLDRDAYGAFGAIKYSLCSKFNPYIRLHYYYFSGDNNPNDTDDENYDAMFWAFVAWNRWVIGELVGETQLPVSNKQEYIVEVGFVPNEGSNVALMWINHRLDSNYYLGTPVASRDWADEINLLCDITLTDNLFMHVGLGYVMPNDAAEEVFGDDQDDFFAQTWFRFFF